MTTESILTSRVCSGCACLCDDIDLLLEEGRIQQINNVCRWGSARFSGRKKFSDRQMRAPLLGARMRPRNGDLRELDGPAAATEIAGLFAEARRLVIYGLCQISQQAFDPLLALASDRETLFIPSEGALWSEYLRLLDNCPLPLTTLEAVRNQADLILFWGANPSHSCPRLVSRYALFARGRFTERGIEDRTAYCVDIQETEMARLSHMIVVAPGQELDLLEAVIAALTGAEPPSLPISKKLFRRLVEAFQASRYPVIFCGRGPCYSPDRRRLMDALARLATAAGRNRPAFLMPLATDFNTVGFYQAFAQARGFSQPGWALLNDIQEWTPTAGDLLLAVSGDGVWFMSEPQRQQLRDQDVPIVSLSGYETMTTAVAHVAVGVGILGVDCAGDATRLDGVVLPLEPISSGDRPTDRMVLEAIRKAVAACRC